MYVRMLQTLGTAMAAFTAGEPYDVTPEMGRDWIRNGIAVETDVPPEWIADLYRRLEAGADGPVLFTPFLGEFGHLIMTHVRMVAFHKSVAKIVCCRPGEEVLFPSAYRWITDWIDPTDDRFRAGAMQSPASLWPGIMARFPCHQFIESGNLNRTQEGFAIHPDRRIVFTPRRRGLRADVLIGVRRRDFHHAKNFPRAHWQTNADALRAHGLTFAVVGHRSSSYDLRGQAWHSGDYDTDAAIEGMQNCRLFISTDTGSAHLASTVGCRQLVIREEFFGRDFIPRMEQVNPGKVHRIEGAWDNPAKIAVAAMIALF